MEEIINFEWCENNYLEKHKINVVSDVSYSLLKDKHYIITYTESSRGEKNLCGFNPLNGKMIDFTTPKISFKENKRNEFTSNDLIIMCDLVGLEYPF